jgi:hypothetical protein
MLLADGSASLYGSSRCCNPACVGLDVGIFDPDLDPDGRYAGELTGTLVAALS